MEVAKRIEDFVYAWLKHLVEEQNVLVLCTPILSETNTKICIEEGAPIAVMLGDKVAHRRLVCDMPIPVC